MCRVANCAMMCSVVLYFGFACCILLKKYIVRKSGMFSIAKCEKQLCSQMTLFRFRL